MIIFEKDGKMNIDFKRFPSTYVDSCVGKDDYGTYLKVGGTRINSVDTLKDMNLTKKADYLYYIECDKYDYFAAEEFFSNSDATMWGQCSSCREGDLYGRDYDWTYDNMSEFIVRVQAKNDRHASVGVSSGIKQLTKDFVESGENSPKYSLLPLMMLDGINDAGVVCNINVVPKDLSDTTGTNPSKQRLNVISTVRYILDYADSADNAVALLKERNIWCPKRVGYEIHLMVADLEKTYCIEFVNNTMVVLDLTDDIKVMTNFNLWSKDGVLHPQKRQDLTPHGSGYERYVILRDGAESATDVNKMRQLMQSVNFSLAYEEETSPVWYSELVHDDLVNTSPDSDFDPIMERAREIAKHKERNGKLWQTVHTSVYDLRTKKLYVVCQENTTDTPFEFEV